MTNNEKQNIETSTLSNFTLNKKVDNSISPLPPIKQDKTPDAINNPSKIQKSKKG